MAIDSTDIGTKYNTQIPTLQSDADIQAALLLYHYGAEAEPSVLNEDSIAGHLAKLELDKVNKKPETLPTTSTSNNLDNKTTTGFYIQTTAAGAAAGSNYPSLNGSYYAGILTVTTDGTAIYQDYQMTNGASSGLVVNEKFWRAKFSGSWNAWTSASQAGHKHNDIYLLRTDATGETGVYGQAAITGAATTVTVNNLDPGKVVVANDSGKLASSTNITATELNYLDNLDVNVKDRFTSLATTDATKPTIVNGKNALNVSLTGTRQFVIARPNPSNTAVPDATITATEGDVWFW
jgi:hypothetical protein